MNEENRPPTLIRMGIVIGTCPPKLQGHLQDMEERLTTYAQLRAESIRKVDLAEIAKDIRSDRMKQDTGGNAPMDIGGLSVPAQNPPEQYPPEQYEQYDPWSWTWSHQDNWSPSNGGEVDLSALYKGKGKGKSEHKGKGKGAWGQWNQ